MNTEKKIDRKEMFSSFIKSLSHQTAITGEIIAKELLAIFEITGISESPRSIPQILTHQKS